MDNAGNQQQGGMTAMFRGNVLVAILLASLLATGRSSAGDNALQSAAPASGMLGGSAPEVASSTESRDSYSTELSMQPLSESKEKASTTMDENTMSNFEATADKIIAAMENHAKQLGVKGVIVVASMDSAGFSWVSRMKAVVANKVLADDPQKSEYPGYNFIGIAYSKAAEMADTKINSGSKVRAAYQGEFGFQGGVIKKIPSGYLLTVFSGATSEQDLEIANVGMGAYVKD
jgi:hypothetical protein